MNHKATFSCVRLELPKSVHVKGEPTSDYMGLTIRVENDEGLLGTLLLGQGSVGWRSSHVRKARRLSWSEFASTMDERLQNRK